MHGARLIELMVVSQEEFSRTFKGSPVNRGKRRGLLRDVAVALADGAPLIRGHAAWALGRIGTPEALEALRGRDGVEEDAWIWEEIALALPG